jgi:hypothetical protein
MQDPLAVAEHAVHDHVCIKLWLGDRTQKSKPDEEQF